MPADPRLMALPALRKLAEEQAKALHRIMFGRAPGGERLLAWTEAHLALLSDLTRFASRWELAALIGARLGREPVDVLQAIQNGGWGWIELCKDAHVDAAELECGADDEAITALALVVLGGAS